MNATTHQNRLLSHTINPDTMEKTLQNFTMRIKQQGDKPHSTVAYQLDLLNQLNQFDFGRFLLQNRGLNGYWTHYMLTHPWNGRKTGKNNRGEPFSELEDFMLNRAPTLLATQQRFEIFLKENQKQVRHDAKLASIPCGLMGELLYLDLQGIKQLELTGIDYDPETLKDAQANAEKSKLEPFVKLIQGDAWHLNLENEFDLISSNGLNIYEPNDGKVTELYRQFFLALKPDGKLVTSFITPPPNLTEHCEWDMKEINSQDAVLAKIIFIDILDAKWQCFRSSEQTKSQLAQAGFNDIEIIYDRGKLFPTVVAYKK